MSSTGVEKRKSAAAQAAEAACASKRQKITIIVQSNQSLLLNFQPEILRREDGFLINAERGTHFASDASAVQQHK